MNPAFTSSSRRASGRASVSTAVACLVVIVALSRSAEADPVDDLIEQGVRLRLQEQPAAALELFERAYAIAPSARTLAQMGLAEGALHRWLDAESHISRALDSHDTPWIANHQNREALEQALVAIRKHIGGVAVAGPRGAAITINGKPEGVLPFDRPVRVEEGTARVEGTAAGYSSASVDIPVLGGRDTTAVLEMIPVPAAAPVSMAPGPVVSTPQSESRWKTWAGISMLGLSAASVGTGIAWVVLDGRPACSAPPGMLCRRVYNTAPQGWATIGVGVAAGVGGSLLLWSDRRSNAAMDVGLGSVGFRGQF